ncbi:MAG: sensor histidine kinase [Actinomycetota bacterium]
MQIELPAWLRDPQAMRSSFAALATAITLVVLVGPGEDVLAWSMLGTASMLYWLWALASRFPISLVAAMGFSTPLGLSVADTDSEFAMAFAVVTACFLATYSSNRAQVRFVILGFMFVITTMAIVDALEDFVWPAWLLALAAGWAVGEAIWRYLDTVDELAHTKSLVADQALLNERRRIARDVHDLVGHSLSVVMLHVTGARHLIHSDPDEAERALEQAEEAGRQSLAEVRRTVALLRDDSEAGVAPAPSADLGDISELVSDFVAAGLEVRLAESGALDRVDPAVGMAGYRIAQEALTNASRHTLGAEVQVSVQVGDEQCEISVVNRGGETIDLGRGSGFGLVSMRERAKSVGGSLIAGPTRDGWSVEATLPVEVVGLAR